MSSHPDADQLKELQDSIYREKVLRARKMTDSERLTKTLELTDRAFAAMLDEVRAEFPGVDDAEANRILSARLDEERREADKGLFIPVPLETCSRLRRLTW